jgi:Fe-Mn family superoxide dismutase
LGRLDNVAIERILHITTSAALCLLATCHGEGDNKETKRGSVMAIMSRRQFLWTSGICTAALGCTRTSASGFAESGEGSLHYPYSLPRLPYDPAALEPHIDAETMKIHHGKHHQAYVDNLNKALAAHPDLHKKPLTELLAGLDKVPESIRTAVRNNGGGHLNHSMFWQMMAKDGGKPTGELAKVIDQSFGSFDRFQAEFANAGRTRFGSGWAWLVAGKGKLEVISTPNQDTPVMDGKTPILGLDVWEHAYYLKYRNMRDSYITAWWNVVNWRDVTERYMAASKSK